MTPLFSLILIVLLSYIGAVYFQNIKSNSLIFKGISHSGIHYLIIGLLLGPHVFAVINTKILNELSVILSFILGWTGFLIGLQINYKQMRRFQVNYYWNAILNNISIYIVLFAGMLGVFIIIDKSADYFQLIIFTIASAISSPLIIGAIKKEWNLRGKIIHFIQFQSAYDNMLGIIIIGIVIAFQNIYLTNNHQSIVNFLIMIFIVTILSFVFYFISKELKNIQQYFLIIIAFLLLIVGTAIRLNQSAVFVSFLFGFAIANLPINSWKLFQTISNTEKPIYLLLLIFIGASNIKFNILILVGSILFSLWRLAIKYFSGYFIFVGISENRKVVNNASLLGMGLGGVSLALILDYQMMNFSQNFDYLIGLILITFVLNDGFSFLLTKPFMKSIKTN